MIDDIILYKHFGDEFARHYAEKETILSLFQALKMDYEEVKNIVPSDRIDDYRCFTIVESENIMTDNLSKIIIDLILGEPMWKQMMDVTFCRGRDCDKKIVVYYDLPDMEHKSGFLNNRYMAKSFAAINNDCGIKTYVVRHQVIYDPDYDEVKENTTWTGPSDAPKTEYIKHPTKEEFQQAEFWMYYSDFVGSDNRIELNPDDWIPGRVSSFHDIKELTFRSEWNEKGRLIIVSADSDDIETSIKWILRNKKDEIYEDFVGIEGFEDFKIDIRNDSEKPLQVSFKTSNRGFDDFINATPNRKYAFVAQIDSEEWVVIDFFERLIKDMNREKKVVNA